MKNRKLEVEIVDDELRICIGLDTLKFAAERSPDPRLTWYEEKDNKFLHFPILSEKDFARDIKMALQYEEEDGTTLIHTLFDDAHYRVVEDGGISIDYDNPTEVDGY